MTCFLGVSFLQVHSTLPCSFCWLGRSCRQPCPLPWPLLPLQQLPSVSSLPSLFIFFVSVPGKSVEVWCSTPVLVSCFVFWIVSGLVNHDFDFDAFQLVPFFMMTFFWTGRLPFRALPLLVRWRGAKIRATLLCLGQTVFFRVAFLSGIETRVLCRLFWMSGVGGFLGCNEATLYRSKL